MLQLSTEHLTAISLWTVHWGIYIVADFAIEPPALRPLASYCNLSTTVILELTAPTDIDPCAIESVGSCSKGNDP